MIFKSTIIIFGTFYASAVNLLYLSNVDCFTYLLFTIYCCNYFTHFRQFAISSWLCMKKLKLNT